MTDLCNIHIAELYNFCIIFKRITDIKQLIADVTDIALEWAEKNVSDNPHISHLIEVRKVEGSVAPLPTEDSNEGELVCK